MSSIQVPGRKAHVTIRILQPATKRIPVRFGQTVTRQNKGQMLTTKHSALQGIHIRVPGMHLLIQE